jgi:hypothetical protein
VCVCVFVHVCVWVKFTDDWSLINVCIYVSKMTVDLVFTDLAEAGGPSLQRFN